MLKPVNHIPDRVVHLIALMGVAVFSNQIWKYSHTQMSVLDEGLYLTKGWLFATGRYTPFQDYGPWTNHMPLSFLIPGWVQMIFEPGIMAGRLLAIICGLLTILGLWILIRRFGSALWAAAGVWAVALNPAIIKIYSVQASQVLAGSILIWTLVFILGPNRPTWHLVLGGALSAALALTRINLVPVMPLAIIYVYWLHGKRTGHLVLASASLIFVAGHAFYWPGILRIWAPWFPEALTPFLDPFRRPPNEGGLWAPQVSFPSRVFSFLQGLRFHFIALTAVLVTLLAFPRRKAIASQVEYKSLVFLVLLFIVLFSVHAWASLANNYCVFCFSTYLSFFSLIGLLTFVIAYPHLDTDRPSARYVWWVLLLVVCAGGLSTFNSIGVQLVEQASITSVLKIEIPRLSGDGSYPLWGIIENLTGRNFAFQVIILLRLVRYGVGVLLGAAGMTAVAVLATRIKTVDASTRMTVINVFFATALLFSPTTFFGGGYQTYDCTGDVIQAYEAAGAYLSEIVPTGGIVFWETFTSPVPLLYLNDVEIFPQQLNGFYSFKIGGDPDSLAKFGHWNRALAEEWASEADVVLMSPDVYRNPSRAWLVELVEGPEFREMPSSIPVHPCNAESRIVIFVRELANDE